FPMPLRGMGTRLPSEREVNLSEGRGGFPEFFCGSFVLGWFGNCDRHGVSFELEEPAGAVVAAGSGVVVGSGAQERQRPGGGLLAEVAQKEALFGSGR